MEKQSIENILKESAQKGLNYFNNIFHDEMFHHFTIQFDCSELEDYDLTLSGNNRKYDLPENVKVAFFRKFDSLNSEISKPNEKDAINRRCCLYFFQFEDGQAEIFYNAYKEYLDKIPERNMSGLKNNPNMDTNILYVGKVKKNLGGRISTHFGYAHSKTGGLQLKYWAKQMNLQLTLHMIVFDEYIGDFINPLELELTRILKPLIGKSK